MSSLSTNPILGSGELTYTSTSSDKETRDGEITATKQSSTGDCWLLASINALSYTDKGAEIIENSLEYEQDGITVDLEGADSIFIYDNKLENRTYAEGDDDVAAIELAIEKVRNGIAQGTYEYTDDATSGILPASFSLTGGTCYEALYYLTGKEAETERLTGSTSELLENFIENGGEDYALTASISSSDYEDGEKIKVKDTNGETVTLYNNHGYAVKSADETSVTVTDPHNSGTEITLSKETFLKYFDYLTGIDLSDDNPDVDMIENVAGETAYTDSTYDYDENNLLEYEGYDVTDDGLDDVSVTYNRNKYGEITSCTYSTYIYDEEGELISSETYDSLDEMANAYEYLA